MNEDIYFTSLEIEFVDGLGRWSDKRIPKLNLLEGYLRCMDKRTHWGRMNRLHIKRHVNKLINKEKSL